MGALWARFEGAAKLARAVVVPAGRETLPQYYRPRRSPATRAVLVGCFLFFLFIYGAFFALTAPYLIVQMAMPVVALALLGIWALPQHPEPPTRTLQIFFFAFFIVLVLWPNYLAISITGLPWITMARLTGFPLVFLLLLSASMSADFRKQIAEAIRAAPPVGSLFACFAVIQALSVFFSDQLASSMNLMISNQVSWTFIFLASCYVFTRPGNVQMWSALFCALTVLIFLLGIAENFNGRVLWAGHVPSFLAIDDESVQRTLAGFSRSGTGRYRVLGTSATSLGMAEYLALAVPFFLYYGVSARRTLMRLALLAAIPIILWVIILTDSRLGVVGFFLGTGAFVFLWALLRWKRVRDSLIAPAVLLAYPVGFGLALIASFAVTRIRVAMWGGSAHAPSNEARVEQFSAGLPLILKRPWGYGAGRGAETLGFRNPEGTVTIDTYYLQVALEYGVIGFIAFYGMFLVTLFFSIRTVARTPLRGEEALLVPATISLMVFVVIKAIFSGAGNHAIAFMLLGMCVALIWRVRRRLAADSSAMQV